MIACLTRSCLCLYFATGLVLLLAPRCLASEHSTAESPWSLAFKFINVAIFVAIIYKLGAKKIGEFFKDRRQKAQGAIDGASQKEEEALRLLGEWREKIAGAEEEAGKIVEASVAEGRKLRERILLEAGEEARAIVEQSRVAAAEEMKNTRAMLGKELAALSAAKAEVLLREKMDAGHQKGLIEEFIRKMEELS